MQPAGGQVLLRGGEHAGVCLRAGRRRVGAGHSERGNGGIVQDNFSPAVGGRVIEETGEDREAFRRRLRGFNAGLDAVVPQPDDRVDDVD